MFHNTVPEERAKQYEPLIGMLRRNWHEPVVLSASEQAEVIERVRERLAEVGSDVSRPFPEVGTALASPRADSNIADDPETDAMMDFDRRMGQSEDRTGTALSLVPGRAKARPYGREAVKRRADGLKLSLSGWVNGLVAVLVVGILVGASLFLFRPALRQSTSQPQIESIASTGPSASAQVKGLRASIHLVTAGPYFLSELVAVDVSLTNHTNAPFRMGGSGRPDDTCFSSALSVQITTGSAPFYTLPRLDFGCFQPLFLTTVAPGRTLAMRYYLPVTKSGSVTIMMGGMGSVPQTGPLAGHWPSLRVQVNPQIPANRTISLHKQGAQVLIQVPQAARTHLLYRESISCDQYLGMGEGLADWSPLATTTLSQPACPTAHKHWKYIVSAPGYSIAAGKRDSS